MSNHQFQHANPPLVLAVDTSSVNASFAIARGEKILASLQTAVPIPHSKTFFVLMSNLLQSANKSLSEVDAFAAATGPGSFTGLRVGLSAIKGLAHALGKPAIGVNSIDAAALASKATGKILVLINAGREEVYAGLRLVQPGRILDPLGEDTVGPALSIAHFFDQFIQGDSLTIVRNGFSEQTAKHIAEEISIYAANILINETRTELHPHYIRPSDAEIKSKE